MNRYLNPIRRLVSAILGGLLVIALAPTGAMAQRTTPVTVVNNTNNPVPVSVQESVVAGCDRTIRSAYLEHVLDTAVTALTVTPGKIFVLTDVHVSQLRIDDAVSRPNMVAIAGSSDPTKTRHKAWGATVSIIAGGAAAATYPPVGNHILSGIPFSSGEDVIVSWEGSGASSVTLSGYEIDAPAP